MNQKNQKTGGALQALDGNSAPIGRREIAGWRCLLAVPMVFCGCLPDPQIAVPDFAAAGQLLDFAAPPDLAAVARPLCDDALGGPALPPTSTEAKPGFDAELLATDLSQLPERLAVTSSSDLNRALVGYLLGKSYAEIGDAISRDAALAQGPLGKVVVAAFAVADPLGLKGADLLFLRRGLYRYYHCVRGYPMTLEGFRRTIWDYSKDSGQVVNSMPKAGPRRLRANSVLGVYVAETLLNDVVRETEIQLTKARPDGAHDFLTYDEAGQQVRTSTFASGGGNMRVAAAPYTCMACHYDKDQKSFNVLVP